MNDKQLVDGLAGYFKSLTPGTALGMWMYDGPTLQKMGGWPNSEGFKFSRVDGSHAFILRSPYYVNGKGYWVIESLNMMRQLYNIDLSKEKSVRLRNGTTVILESYIASPGSGKFTMQKFKSTLADIGVTTDEITVIEDSNPNWEKVTVDLLQWGIYREKVRQMLQPNEGLEDAPSNDGKLLKADMNQSLNQILYGPPGTGKTYATIVRALSIIENVPEHVLEKESREALRNRYKAYVKNGQVAFVTFHQSMSYEDFIEGIKPIMGDVEDRIDTIGYKIEDGLFMQCCTRAIYACYKAEHRGISKFSKEAFFDLAYDEMLQFFRNTLSENKQIHLKIKSKTAPEMEVISVTDRDNIKLRPGGGTTEQDYLVSKERLRKLFLHFDGLEQVKNIDKEFRAVIGGSNSTAYWAVLNNFFEITRNAKNQLKQLESIEIYDYQEVKKTIKWYTISPEDLEGVEPDKFVLIIDEINRGNVSQIFGELITLIEEDKRLGKREALEVRLPYSKDKPFGVPPNLYIIGTMNTADRSVEALDTALRRRFSFEHMPPKPELLTPNVMLWNLLEQYAELEWDEAEYRQKEEQVLQFLGAEELVKTKMRGFWDVFVESDYKKKEDFSGMRFSGITLSQILSTINARIEKLVDSDHQIGHSYFMRVATLDDLLSVFYRSIIPLLQEYFFGDYGKIGLILGSGFVRTKQEVHEDKNLFADFKDYENAGDFNDRVVYEIVDYRKNDLDFELKVDQKLIRMDFEKAINLMLKVPIE